MTMTMYLLLILGILPPIRGTFQRGTMPFGGWGNSFTR